MICYIAGNFEVGNLLNLTVVGQHSQVKVHCYPTPPDVIDAMLYCPLRDFGGKQFHCKMSRDLEVTKKSARCWPKISSFIKM